MSNTNPDLAALIGSRICHDLISPIGAINNGLELLGMAGAAEGPELELIGDSVNNASARIRFFRLAFGAASDQQISVKEVCTVLNDTSRGSKVSVTWEPDTPQSRSDVRLALLAEQCVESALSYGGDITIREDDGRWSVAGQAAKLNVDPALWSILAKGSVPPDIAPAHVHFALLSVHSQSAGRRLHTEIGETDIVIRF